MPRERCDKLYTAAATCASAVPCLFYGVALTSKAGNASMVIHDYDNITGTTVTSRFLVVEQGAGTGTTTMFLPMACKLDTGITVTLSAKAVATVFFSKRG